MSLNTLTLAKEKIYKRFSCLMPSGLHLADL